MKNLIVVLVMFIFSCSGPVYAGNHGHHGHHGHHRSDGSHRYRTQLDDVMATAYAVNTLNQMFAPRLQVGSYPGAATVPVAIVPQVNAPYYSSCLPPNYEICYQNGRRYVRYWKCGQFYYIPAYPPHPLGYELHY